MNTKLNALLYRRQKYSLDNIKARAQEAVNRIPYERGKLYGCIQKQYDHEMNTYINALLKSRKA